MSTDGWQDYWRDPSRAGCVERHDGLGKALDHVWSTWGTALPRRARLLDLATGAGDVLRRLQRIRPDLKLEGVDRAEHLPTVRGLKLRGGISLEHLPYPDSCFHAVTSQFGWEYAEPNLAAAELARVLVPGGHAMLVVHDRDGPVVQHNLARADALAWAVGPDGPIARARAPARARQAFPKLPTPRPLVEAIAEARRFPGQGVAAEIASATLSLFDGPPRLIEAGLDRLEVLGRGELARLADLGQAARDAQGIARDVDLLARSGLRVAAPALLHDALGTSPLAWMIHATRVTI